MEGGGEGVSIPRRHEGIGGVGNRYVDKLSHDWLSMGMALKGAALMLTS